MKCFYYLTSTLDSTRKITTDLQEAGVNEWFIHVLSKDLAGLKKYKIHSSNYLETLDILRYGILGGVLGLFTGLIAVLLFSTIKPFGPDMPVITYFLLIGFLTLFGTWEGGLAGIAAENNKTSLFHDELLAGNYLILIYARKEREKKVKEVMQLKHPEAKLVAIDPSFYNPLTRLKRI